MSNTESELPTTPSIGTDLLSSQTRTFIAAVAGWLVGKGLLDGNIATAAIPLVVYAIPAVWSALKVRFNHKVTNQLKDAVNASGA